MSDEEDLLRALESCGLSPADSAAYCRLLLERGGVESRAARVTTGDLEALGVQRPGHCKAVLAAVRRVLR